MSKQYVISVSVYYIMCHEYTQEDRIFMHNTEAYEKFLPYGNLQIIRIKSKYLLNTPITGIRRENFLKKMNSRVSAI